MKRLTERDEYGNADVIGVNSVDLQANLAFEEFNKVTEALNRLAYYEDLEEQGRLHVSKAYCCPKCGKHELTPRIDGEFYYCFGCKTQFAKAEAEAELAPASDVPEGE